MSGERIVLAGDVDGVAARLVQVTARLASLDLGPYVDVPERAVRWLLDGGPQMRAVTADSLRDVLGPLVEQLTG